MLSPIMKALRKTCHHHHHPLRSAVGTGAQVLESRILFSIQLAPTKAIDSDTPHKAYMKADEDVGEGVRVRQDQNTAFGPNWQNATCGNLILPVPQKNE